MNFSIQEIKNREQWNRFLLDQPTQAGIFLQSWEWLAFQESLGRRVFKMGALLDGKLAAVCGMVKHVLPLGKSYLYIPRGPIAHGEWSMEDGEFLKAIQKVASKEGAVFLRFEPVEVSSIRHQVSAEKASQPIQPKETLIADMSAEDDARLAAMHEKTRYNIRLALKKGIRCEVSGVSGERQERNFSEFWALLQETAKRDKFHTHPRAYYEKMMGVLDGGGAMSVCLWIARHDGKAIAGALVGYFGDTTTYLHGASSHEYRNLMAPYALHWEIMRDARAAGFKKYDFWGIDEKKWPGVTRFKKGFGGEVVEYPGAFDLPISRFWYTLYRLGKRVR
ncbi:MAG: peptidoglycan bridge formation glycyltransferase FemA/FemB family protein [Patescibacteria group bacterium]